MAKVAKALLQLQALGLMLRRGELSDIVREFARRIYSNDASYILRRDLDRPLTPWPRAKIPFLVRPMAPEDIPVLTRERPRRLPMLRADIPRCYVAMTENAEICFMQWIVPASEQDNFKPYFKGALLPYERDTVCCEFSYTPERFRGQNVMASALAGMIEQASPPSAKWAITYVRTSNIASLKGCAKAGFRPWMVRYERWRLFRLRQGFQRLEQPALYPFEQATSEGPPPKRLWRRIANRMLGDMARTCPGATTVRPWLHRKRGVTVGERVFIGDDVYLENEYPELVSIGDGTAVGLRTIILAHVGRRETKVGPMTGRVKIGRHVFIGAGCTICASPNTVVTIGDGAVLSAGSVLINRSVAPGAFMAPPPAQEIGTAATPLPLAHSYEEFLRGLLVGGRTSDRPRITNGEIV